jgi:hypothetical protein
MNNNESKTSDVETNKSGEERRSQANHHVRFSQLEVHEFRQVLGDNVPGTGGPPLGLADKPFQSTQHSVDEYEEARSKYRRNPGFMLIYAPRRKKILQQEGFASDELEAAADEVERVTKSREVNAEGPETDAMPVIKLGKKKSKKFKGWKLLFRRGK